MVLNIALHDNLLGNWLNFINIQCITYHACNKNTYLEVIVLDTEFHVVDMKISCLDMD